MSADTDVFELDDDARELLAAMRQSSALPADLHDRVWTRLQASVAPTAKVPRVAWRKVAIVGLTAAAAAVLVAVLAGRPTTTQSVDPPVREQASYTEKDATSQGEATSRVREKSPAAPPDEADAPEAPEDASSSPPQANGASPPAEVRPSPSDRPRGTRDRAVPKPEPSLAQEIAAIEKIRAALLADDPERALVHVRAHARRFPGGALVQEREALRAVASCSLGQPGAKAKGDAFIAAHADSPLVGKVRAACSEP